MTSKAPKDAPDRRKFIPRPARSPEEKLPRLYRALTDQVDDGHFGNAIRTCRKILDLDKTSISAYQTLLFLYLQTDEYPAALNLLENPPSQQKLEFERAYCLYRLHREREALKVLEGLSRGEKEQHLEAQIRYRLGEYTKTQDVYENLLAHSSPSDPDHADILNNLSSTSAYIDFMSHGYHQHLGQGSHTTSEADLESHVPTLPTGWATRGMEGSRTKQPLTSKTIVNAKVTEEAKRKKPRHRLPKGAVVGKPFNEDPERWLPMKQRQSFMQAQAKKKGASLSMGTGMTQGSTMSTPTGAGGGGKKKKGKK